MTEKTEASIEVRQNNRCYRICNLSSGTVYKIGREQNNDIFIPLREASREHAKVYFENGCFIYDDISSSGSLLNTGQEQRRIHKEKVILNHGDVIMIADVELVYRNHAIKKTYGEFDDVTKTLDDQPDQTLTVAPNAVLEPITEEINVPPVVVHKAYFTIGSDPEDHLQLAETEASPHHCAIKSFNRSHYLESPNCETYCNGARISNTPTLLRNNDVIRIGEKNWQYKAQADVQSYSGKYGIITRSPKMLEIIATIEQVADINLPVLLLGETGTGKELVAKAIHQLSSRKHKKFVSVNCANIDNNLFGSELFGHKAGAFTGAISDRVGCFQEANFGTLFLDEMAEMNMDIQAKLLRALEYNEIRPLGSNAVQKVDVRVVAATNKNIVSANVRKVSSFREDLFHRIGMFVITLPPLRERPEDVPLLMDSFLNLAKLISPKANNKYFTSSAYDEARERLWPGNVRELYNACLRTIFMSKSDDITVLLGMGAETTMTLVDFPQEWLKFLKFKKQMLTKGRLDYDLIKKEFKISKSTWHRMDGEIETHCRKIGKTTSELIEMI